MKQIICIGECALDIIFKGNEIVGSMTGGRISNAASILARKKLPVKLVSEIAADAVGDRIVDALRNDGVDITSVDRFTEGLTPINIYNVDDQGNAVSITRYEQYPEECFDVIWPRIEAEDIVVFGGFYALDMRMRQRMLQLLNTAAERKALLVYLPGFLAQQQPRITRVMPQILENLEIANTVIVRHSDLKLIFGTDEGTTCYNDHISFYCRSLIEVDPSCNCIHFYNGDKVTTAETGKVNGESLMWNAGIVAGIIEAFAAENITVDNVDDTDDDFRRRVLTKAVSTASQTLAGVLLDWQKTH